MEIQQPSWRGAHLQSRKDVHGSYMAMISPKSLLYIPIADVLPDATYRITLEVKNASGNGIIYSNIYGNKIFDFPHVNFKCEKNEWSTYDIDLRTKKFPNTLPLIFRIWRAPSGTGEIHIRKIVVNLLNDVELNTNVPQLISTNSDINNKSIVKNIFLEPKPELELELEPEQELEIINKYDNNKFIPENIITINDINNYKIKSLNNFQIEISVIISVFNRIDFLERSLMMYGKQTIPKCSFEIVIVDDNSTQDIKNLCKKFSNKLGINIKYILIDKNKGAIKPKTFVPALSSNIGLKKSQGNVIIIVGPETLINEDALEISWNLANQNYCIYGNIYRSNKQFTKSIEKMSLDDINFNDILKIPGATSDKSILNGWWWYYMAVKKDHIMAINGVDERFMLGISGEDDDLANRMIFSGIQLKRSTEIVGIHQDHSESDKQCDQHNWRFNSKIWKELRKHNENLLNSWPKHKYSVANENIDWGSENAILELEDFK